MRNRIAYRFFFHFTLFVLLYALLCIRFQTKYMNYILLGGMEYEKMLKHFGANKRADIR